MTKKRLILPLATVLLFGVFLLTVYTPHLIYFSQEEYFAYGFYSMVARNFVVGILSSIGFILIAILLPKIILKLITVTSFVVVICIWLQVDFFTISYGILDGSDINFSEFNWRGTLELLAFASLLLISLIFKEWVLKNITFVTLVLFFGLFTNVAYVNFSNPFEKAIDQPFDTEVNLYSGAKNVILIVLDGFGGEYFQKEINENMALREEYQGFVSYQDAISNYSATVGSIPSMLIGEMYPKDVKYKEFIVEEVQERGMQKLFEQKGYKISVISPSLNFREIYPERFLADVTSDKGAMQTYESLKLLDYALFRSVFHWFKPYIYSDGDWAFSQYVAKLSELPKTYSERGKLFLDYVTKNAMVDDKSPRFKLIHATIPHPDFVYDRKCKEKKFPKGFGSERKMVEHSKCALKLLNTLFEKYKSMGIYDNSLIVVTSDHGARVYNNPERTGFPSDFELSASGILFMIKGVGQKGDFKQVSQPFSLLKLKENLVNESLHDTSYSEMTDKLRKFYAYQPIHISERGYFSGAPLYEVSDDYTDPNSWELKGFQTNACKKQDTPIQIELGKANRSGYCGAFGFKQIGKSFDGIWTVNPDNRIIFGINLAAINQQKTHQISMSVKANIKRKIKQLEMDVSFNGKAIGSKIFKTAEMTSLSFDINPSLFVEGDNEIQLIVKKEMSEIVDKKSMKKMKYGVFIKDISIDEK